MAIISAVLATFLFTLIVLNLSSGERKIREIPKVCTVNSGDFVIAVSNLFGFPLVGGNRITSLTNGAEIFPAMLSAIRKAEHTICFETYIYWSGKIGKEFAEAFAERARKGVKVHIILDWVGCGSMDGESLDLMINAGVEIEKFHPIRWYSLSRLNNRTHRKLLIVDGKIGFTGGVGIADVWLGNADSPGHWRDSHFQLEGPAVSQMQSAFMDNWTTTRAKVLYGPKYFPRLTPKAGSLSQITRSSAGEGTDSTRLLYLLSIVSAEVSIKIANAYFVPDDLSVKLLVEAQNRGVSIEIIVPGTKTDVAIVRRASRSRYGKLLEAGIKIFEYKPTMFHCKVMIVDSVWVTVGSTNFDSRSFRLNDEVNLNIYDEQLAKYQSDLFEKDKEKSREINLKTWQKRPFKEKAIDWASALLRAQL